MVEKQTIISLYRIDGHSKRRISRDLNIDRKTVHRVLKEYEAALLSDNPNESIEQLFRTNPAYNSSNRKQIALTDIVKELIDGYISENNRRVNGGISKQLMLKSDMYEQLIDQNINISYSTVCNYVRRKIQSEKDKYNPAFIRQEYQPGEICEFDWGEVKLYIRNKLVKFNMAVFTLAHSNGRYAYLFRYQNTLAFMESHRNFIKDVKGVPYLMVYDNMRVAIKKFVGREKHPTDSLLRLSNFYKFNYRFCNIRAVWEKGHVEKSVEFVRRKSFSIKYHFDSIEEAQAYLHSTCNRLNSQIGSLSTIDKREKLQVDLESLQPHINEIGCFEMESYKVDKWSTICMNKVHYSVPDYLVGKYVDIKIYSEKIVLFDGNNKVATHERIYTSGEWSIKLEHYIKTLLRKPGAVSSSTALSQMPQKMQDIYNINFKDNPKDFVMLISYAVDNNFSNEDIINCYSILKKRGIRRPTLNQLRASLHNINEPIDVELISEKTEQNREIEDSSMDILNCLTEIMDNRVINNHLTN